MVTNEGKGEDTAWRRDLAHTEQSATREVTIRHYPVMSNPVLPTPACTGNLGFVLLCSPLPTQGCPPVLSFLYMYIRW